MQNADFGQRLVPTCKYKMSHDLATDPGGGGVLRFGSDGGPRPTDPIPIFKGQILVGKGYLLLSNITFFFCVLAPKWAI